MAKPRMDLTAFVGKLLEEQDRYYSVSVARIAFQACSFNHSAISPFRVNDLRAVRLSRIHRDCLASLDGVSMQQLPSR